MPQQSDDANTPANTDRRSFLKTAAGACLIAAAGTGEAIATEPSETPNPAPVVLSRRRRTTTLESLHLAAFQPAVHSPFTVRLDGLGIRLTLTEVNDRTGRTIGAQGEAFSLLFRGPAGQPLEQGTYAFEQAALGAFSLFIVPVRREARYVYYEAIFNRALPR